MKKLSLILIILFSISDFAFSQWTIQYTHSPSQSIYCLRFFDNNTGYHSGVLYNSSTMNIYKTTNGGLNYTAQNSNLTAQRFMSIFMKHPDTVFISGNDGKILRTVNGGNNWIQIYTDTLKQFWGLFFVNSNTGFTAGSNGLILKTTNKGDNWTTLNSTTSTALDGIYFVNETTGYVGGANIFLKTTDAGQTWVNKLGSFISPFETAEDVYFADANTGIYGTNASRIVKTTNGGDSWYLVNNIIGGAVWGLEFPAPNIGYACTDSGKVMKTVNGGENWIVQNTPLTGTDHFYEISFPSVNTGYVCTWSGKILKTTDGGATYVNNTNSGIPREYKLFQNYPNPFNPTTNIKFAIPENGQVTLKVYNIIGKEIKTLVDGNMQAGEYETNFDARGMSSGIYFYKLESGDFKDIKRMVLLK
jgi:photosystem II stability/assembly factor-like uncharacterized protein